MLVEGAFLLNQYIIIIIPNAEENLFINYANYSKFHHTQYHQLTMVNTKLDSSIVPSGQNRRKSSLYF